MSIRMQQRRGTASQWTSANPVLNAGEIGFETDTGKFKIGNGSSSWTSLTYAGGTDYATQNYVNTQITYLINSAPGALDTLNELAAAINNDANFFTTISNALNLKAPLADPTFTGTVSAPTPDNSSNTTVVPTTQWVRNNFGLKSDLTTAQSNITTLQTNVGTLDNSINTPTTGLGARLSAAESAITTNINNISTANTNLTNHELDTTNIHGIANTADLATKTYADNAATTAGSNAASTASNALASHELDTTNIHGITDTADLATLSTNQTITGNKTFSGTVAIGNVSATEISYLDGVTSAIQTQINAKANLAGPTFTGNVVLPSTTTIGNVSATELGYVDGVTSAIQTQIDGKANSSHTHAISNVTNLQTSLDAKANLAGPTFTGNVVLPSTTTIGNVSATELGYVDGVTSGIQAQIDAKASLSGATFTGFVNLHSNPTQALHAVTKQYVDGIESGLKAKPAVYGATSTNIDATYNNGTNGVGATLTKNVNGTINSVAAGGLTNWTVGKGILVKNQTNKAHNGRYVVTDLGSTTTPYVLTRCGLCDEANEIPGAYIFVQDGTHKGTGWVQIVNDPTTFVVGTNDIDVFQFSGVGSITGGSNITVTGTSVAVSDSPTFTGNVVLPSTTTIGNVSATELGYVDGVTSAIQTQINGKANSSHTHAISDVTNLQTSLDAKANLAGPTFTGNVVLPSTTTIGNVSATELGYVDGVTSAIQTQIDGKADKTVSLSTKTGAYTFALVDLNTLVQYNSPSAASFTIPQDNTFWPIGQRLEVLQINTGQLTIAGGSGVTVNGTPTTKIRTQWSSASIIKRAANVFVVVGDLASS